MKNLGIILIVLGAVLLLLSAFVIGDLADQNWFTWGCFIVLIVGGLITHIIVNKKLAA